MSFHLYRITEIYSNPSGTVQFIELSVGNANGESQWSGVRLQSLAGAESRSFTFPSNLPSSNTANTTVLVATQGFANLGLVVPDFIVPDGFLFLSGGRLNFGGADEVTYGRFPANGEQSLDRNGAAATASPRNFVGSTASLPLPVLQGTTGNDELTGTALSERIEGGAGNDSLRTGGGNDIVNAGEGDDAAYSGLGNDTLDGGPGYDYLYFGEATAGVQIDMRAGTATGGAGSDRFSNFELLFGTPFADTFVGHDQGVAFLGGEGNDHITGGAGNDRLEGNGGDDFIDGKDGADSVAYYSAAGAVVVNLSAGTASGGLGNDTLLNIEGVVGSVFGDTLTGSSANNLLDGADGNDRFFSTAGDDVLLGGLGLDRVDYPLARSAYTLRVGIGEYPFALEKPDAAGSDSLRHIERLHFSGRALALDLDAGAGQVAKLLGAVFGRAAVGNAQYAGIGLKLVDEGMGYEALGALAVAAAGKSAAAEVVALLWTNVVGSAPTAEQAAPYVAMLNSGTSIGALAVLAADTALNIANIDLVGLAQTGLDFLPAP
ncbi:calcium-binding protein [Inhella sp.]|uniref:calcium-binding protein n=1 Tax=Inhella sp. TaxID=1921806 RepID=UPI0035B1CF8B